MPRYDAYGDTENEGLGKKLNPTDAKIKVTDRRRPVGEESAKKFLEQVDEKPQPKTLDQMIADCFIEPGPGRVVVQPDDFTYKGRVIIPKTGQKSGQTGVVVKCGIGLTMEFYGPTDVKDTRFGTYNEYRTLKPGDHIVYGMWTGTQLQFENRPSYRILSEGEVLGLVTEGATKLESVEA